MTELVITKFSILLERRVYRIYDWFFNSPFVKRELPKKENELIFSAEITLPQMLKRCFCTKLILR